MSTAINKLTDTALRNAKPRENAYKLFDGQGLYIEIRPNGSEYWRLKYCYLDTEKRLAVGVYPEVSLADARAKRAAARQQLDGGNDPARVRRQLKRQAALDTANTFEAIAREWHRFMTKRWTKQHADQSIASLEQHIFP